MKVGVVLQPIFAISTVLEYLVLSAALLVVAGGLMFWAIAIRKPPGKPRYKYHRTSPEQPPAPKRRRKRRSEPPRNPTLAETRGLPPVRESGPGVNSDHQY